MDKVIWLELSLPDPWRSQYELTDWLQLVYEPNHTCVLASVPELYCKTARGD